MNLITFTELKRRLVMAYHRDQTGEEGDAEFIAQFGEEVSECDTLEPLVHLLMHNGFEKHEAFEYLLSLVVDCQDYYYVAMLSRCCVVLAAGEEDAKQKAIKFFVSHLGMSPLEQMAKSSRRILVRLATQDDKDLHGIIPA